MAARRFVAAFGVVVVFAVGASAGEDGEVEVAVAASNPAGTGNAHTQSTGSEAAIGGMHRDGRQPWLHPSLPEDVRLKVALGFALALEHVEGRPECRAMFSDLGTDPVETLGTSMYFPVKPHRKVAEICRGRNMALTSVGAASTFLCPEFAKLSVEHAAMYLLHEALHHAGLPESPQDRGAMTSRQINAMVAHRCGL